MTSTWVKNEWTAFTEADLLGAGSDNGTSIGCGDSFTMPGSATVTMSTWDNDSSLSGDNWNDEQANDTSGQYARVDGARVGSQMYAESYHVLRGSDGKTYYLIEIEVEGHGAPGVGDDYFTFYGQVPPAGVELTVTNTCNVTGCWVDYSCLGAGPEVPPNTPPSFTDLPENGIICVDENTTFVIDANATDADGDALTFEIVGGRDASFFEIDAHTGELTFIGAPDFEDPQSGGASNTYDVTIKVSDGKGGEDTKALWVKVKDVDESTVECVVIEAEDMHQWGFHTVHGDQASGGELVKINCAGGTGDLSTTFTGESGEYDFTLRVQDENDGQSTIMVKINGEVVGTFNLDHDNNGGGSNDGGFSELTLENIQINAGDTITLWAQADGCEFVRIDKIELCKDGEACPEGFSLQDFSGIATGVTVADQFDGFTVSAQRDGDAADSENDAMIFDTANPTGGDNDLGFANQGNAIIISEDNDASDPDDNAGGGTITFDFDNPSDLHDVKLLDIEGTGTFIELFDENGDLIKRIDVTGTGDNTAQTIKLDAADVSQMVVTLHTSGAVDDLCFKPGEAPAPGSLSGRYFIDANKNDIDDNEDGVEGVTVELLDADGNGTGITTTTAADGSYSFGDLAPGTYGVKFTDTVSGRTLVDANQGGDDAIDSDAIDLGGNMSQITNITVVSGADTPDNDAGVEDPGTASIGDFVWFDANKDGLQGADEAGIEGVEVTLTSAGADGVLGTADDTTTTTSTLADGSYLFDGLDAGEYKVTFETALADGRILTTSAGAADAAGNDSDADQTSGMTSAVTLDIGEAERDVDAGYVDPGTASVGDYVWFDADKDGIQDADEVGIEGVNVTLTGAGADGVFGTTDDTTDSTSTNASGGYLFDGLDAGKYKVTFDTTTAAGLVLTAISAAAADAAGNDSDADQTTGMTSEFDLSIGEAELDIDAGFVDPGTASIGDKVFFDTNGNGVQDLGEAGVDGVTVVLYDENGVAIDDTITSGGGMYLFDELDAGDYSVGFEIADTFVFTGQNEGGDDEIDSDADQITGLTGSYTLAIGEENLTVDAGIVNANINPEPADDMGMTCADEELTIDVLANDSDADGDTLTITMVDGQAIVDGGDAVETGAGTFVKLVGGQLVINGEDAYAALDIGETALENISYTVDDGNGGTATANVAVTFCGDANTAQSLVDSLPGSVKYKIADGFLTDPFGDFGYDMQITDAGGDARLEGLTFTSAYCLDFARDIESGSDFGSAPELMGDLKIFDDSTAASVIEASQTGVNGSALDNINELNWILNQDFENDGTGSIDGNFTGWEVQFAIWELTNGFPSGAALGATPSIGQIEDVDYIVDRAIAEGFDFEAGVGDIIGIVIDPNPATPENEQPFLIGVNFEDYDCIC